MPSQSKSTYTNKQKRMVSHVDDNFEKRASGRSGQRVSSAKGNKSAAKTDRRSSQKKMGAAVRSRTKNAH